MVRSCQRMGVATRKLEGIEDEGKRRCEPVKP